MNNLIVEISLSIIIVFGTLYLSHFFVRNNTTRQFIINNKLLHPNQISIFRVFIGFIGLAIFHYSSEQIGILLFVFACILDATDGIIARGCNLTSELGKSLDPLADKVVYFVPLLYFGFSGKISIFLVILFIIVDILGQFSRIVLDRLKLEKKANIYGKIKTIFIFTLIFYLMIIDTKNLFTIDIFYNNLFTIIGIILALLSIIFKFINIKK